MNLQRSLNHELTLYKFELGHNTTETTKNKCAKGEGTVDHSTVTRRFKKFSSGCKNLDIQTRSGRPEIMDSKAVLPVIEANSESIR